MHFPSLMLLFLLQCIISFAYANTPGNARYWRCIVYDKSKAEWVAQSNYQITALNKAFDACKKQSNIPKTCQLSKSNCGTFINGHSVRPLWYCVALDDRGTEWTSTNNRTRDSAALEAKDNCKKNSPSPETCYINLITCTHP